MLLNNQSLKYWLPHHVTCTSMSLFYHSYQIGRVAVGSMPPTTTPKENKSHFYLPVPLLSIESPLDIGKLLQDASVVPCPFLGLTLAVAILLIFPQA